MKKIPDLLSRRAAVILASVVVLLALELVVLRWLAKPEPARESAFQGSAAYPVDPPAEEIVVYRPASLQWEDQEPPVDDDQVAVVVKPPERVGPVLDPASRLPSAPHVPPTVVEECDHYYSNELDAADRVKRNTEAPDINFEVEVDGLVNPYPVLLVTRLPGEALTVKVRESDRAEEPQFEIEASAGQVRSLGPTAWRWTAPDSPGMHCVKIREKLSAETMCLHAAVLRPYNGEEFLGAYRLGSYKDKPLRGNPRYKRPRGFIEVTKKNEATWVSPHFQLRQFVCKQKGGYPKYMLLETRLLLKLELLISDLQDDGVEVNSLFVTSGFRTPYYNRLIGNKTYYSRHLYGDAADLYVDTNRDGKMDDLDGSGGVDGEDALLLHRSVEKLTTEHEHLAGGLGFYGSRSYRNPFIHIDTRGYKARWGR